MWNIRILLLWILVALVVAFGIVVGWYVYSSDTASYERSIEKIVACMEQKRDAIICTRPIIRALLETATGAVIVDDLAERLPAMQCHFVSHIVGQQSFDLHGSIELAISQCSRACDSGCPHGVIGEAFAQELGFDDPDLVQDFDLKHLNADDVRKIGKRLCTSAQTCHGVGHVLFQAYGSFPEALAICKEVTPAKILSFCLSGIFMEYADILSSRNMRVVPDLPYPEVDDLDTLCAAQPTADARSTCFLYLPRVVVATFEANEFSKEKAVTRFHAICNAYPKGSEPREQCYSGIGAYDSYLLWTDTARARARCEQFSDPRDQASCHYGMVRIDIEDRQSIVFPYCASLSTTPFKSMCYQGAFNKLDAMGVAHEESLALCSGERVCEAAATQYATDPWQFMRATFAQ